MASYKVADSNTAEAWNNAEKIIGSAGAIVSDLAEGDYVVTELPVEDMRVTAITGGKMIGESGNEHNDADTTARRVTVHVTAGDTTAVQSGASVEYTNNKTFVDIKVIKIDETTRGSAAQKKLPSAGFQLFKYTVPADGSTGTYTVYPDEAGSKKTTSNKEGASYGTLTFDSLPDGHYKIVETQSPSGYIKMADNNIFFDIVDGVVTRYAGAYSGTARDTEEPIAAADVVIAESSEVDQITYKKATTADPATFTVGNNPGVALPSTGGTGTRIYRVLGGCLMLLSIGLIMNRKKEIYRNT